MLLLLTPLSPAVPGNHSIERSRAAPLGQHLQILGLELPYLTAGTLSTFSCPIQPAMIRYILLAQGIPVEHRPWAWMAISGAEVRKGKRMAGYFDAMVHRGEVDSEVGHQIELVGVRMHARTRRCAAGTRAGLPAFFARLGACMHGAQLGRPERFATARRCPAGKGASVRYFLFVIWPAFCEDGRPYTTLQKGGSISPRARVVPTHGRKQKAGRFACRPPLQFWCALMKQGAARDCGLGRAST